jgi:hypothetical protein
MNSRGAEHVFGPLLLAVDDQGELGFHAHRGEARPLRRGGGVSFLCTAYGCVY